MAGEGETDTGVGTSRTAGVAQSWSVDKNCLVCD